MSEKKDLYKKTRVQSSVNPQGKTEDAAEQQPDSQLEDKAKKTNTKR